MFALCCLFVGDQVKIRLHTGLHGDCGIPACSRAEELHGELCNGGGPSWDGTWF